MAYNSVSFALFFTAIFFLYWSITHRFRWAVLLLVSYAYCLSWHPAATMILLIVTCIHYFSAIAIAATTVKSRRVRLLVLSVALSVLTLVAFKYCHAGTYINVFSFFSDFANSNQSLISSNIVIPIGISFYSLQLLGYSLDVYYKKIKPERHFGLFALFASYFPQLTSGPVERASDMLPQYKAPRYFDYSIAVSGARLIMWGLFKKVAVADRLSEILTPVYGDPSSQHGVVLWLTFLLFPVQVYADFSGYIDISRGCSRMLGINLSINFDQPFFAKSITEFWKKWNITVSNWYRDYVFFPLFLNIKRANLLAKLTIRAKHNIAFVFSLITMFLLLGLWHGLKWTFLVTGICQSIFILLETYVPKYRPKKNTGEFRLMNYWNWIRTFFLLCFAPHFLRAESVREAFGYFWQMISVNYRGIWHIEKSNPFVCITLANIMVMLATEHFYTSSRLKGWVLEKPAFMRWVIYFVLIALICSTGIFYKSVDFIYFKY